jgi:hypothetical protein
MPDITKIAADCATRIMDRMEMCRGSAILKGDIEREVEMALAQATAAAEPEEVRWFRVSVSGPDGTLTKTVPVEPEPQSLIDKAMKALNEEFHKSDGWEFAVAAIRQEVELPYVAPVGVSPAEPDLLPPRVEARLIDQLIADKLAEEKQNAKVSTDG